MATVELDESSVNMLKEISKVFGVDINKAAILSLVLTLVSLGSRKLGVLQLS